MVFIMVLMSVWGHISRCLWNRCLGALALGAVVLIRPHFRGVFAYREAYCGSGVNTRVGGGGGGGGGGGTFLIRVQALYLEGGGGGGANYALWCSPAAAKKLVPGRTAL